MLAGVVDYIVAQKDIAQGFQPVAKPNVCTSVVALGNLLLGISKGLAGGDVFEILGTVASPPALSCCHKVSVLVKPGRRFGLSVAPPASNDAQEQYSGGNDGTSHPDTLAQPLQIAMTLRASRA